MTRNSHRTAAVGPVTDDVPVQDDRPDFSFSPIEEEWTFVSV